MWLRRIWKVFLMNKKDRNGNWEYFLKGPLKVFQQLKSTIKEHSANGGGGGMDGK
jgi:hypothetical protein